MRGAVSLPRPNAVGWKGLLFLAGLVTAFYAAPYANLFFLLLVFLVLLGGLDWIWTWRNLAGVDGGLGTPEPMPSGVEVRLRGWIDPGPRTRFAVDLCLEVTGIGRVDLPCGLATSRTEVEGALDALPRGIYAIPSAELASTWPLGFLRIRRRIPAPGDLVIYPTPGGRAGARSGAGGEYGVPGVPGGALQPSTLREYRPGDALRQVHWKASARRGDLVVQEWEDGTGSGFEVVLDRRTDGATLEESLSTVSALVHEARAKKEVLTLHSQDLSASFGSGHRPWAEVLRFLAGAEILPAHHAPPPPASPEILRLPSRKGGRS